MKKQMETWNRELEQRWRAIALEVIAAVKKADEQLEQEWSYGADGFEGGFFLLERDAKGILMRIEPIPDRLVIPIRELPHRWAVVNMVLIGASIGAVIGTAILLWR